MDGGAWKTAVHVVAESRTQLSDFTFTFHFHALEKEMATHSSVLAWRIPGTGEPGGLPSLVSHRVRHDQSDLTVVVQETGIKTIPMGKKCKKAKWLSGEALQIAVKRREVKSKGKKERYKHLNAEFQRIARRDSSAINAKK